MSSINLYNVSPAKRHHPIGPNEIIYSNHEVENINLKTWNIARIHFGVGILRNMHLETGDRVNIIYDPDEKKMLISKADSGFKLITFSHNSIRKTIQFTATKDMRLPENCRINFLNPVITGDKTIILDFARRV